MLKANEHYRGYVNIDWNVFNEKRLYEAIIYHDIVYDIGTKGPSNEVLSANLYAAAKGTTAEFDSAVPDMIKATEFHFTDNEYDDLTSYLLDLDLMSLTTTNEAELFQTQENIDREFLTVFEEDEVYTKRYEFLSKIMAPKARMRILKFPVLQDQMASNIQKLVSHYASLAK